MVFRSEPTVRLRNAISHYRAIYEYVAGVKESDYATTLVTPDGHSEDVLKKFGLEKNKYVLLNVNATTFYRRWPSFRFSKVAEYLDEQGLDIVLMGADINRAAVGEFQKVYWPKSLHLAVALRKPSICIVGGGQFGAFARYGYPDINHWLWQKTDCYFDDWRCNRGLSPGTPAQCIEAVSLSAALQKTRSLLEYVQKNRSYPLEG